MTPDRATRAHSRRRGLPLLSDLKAVEIFVAVVETQSLTQAARRLGVGVSTVSKKLSELEGRARARLLNRTTRVVAVTDTGKSVYAHCLRIIEEIEAAEAALWDQDRAPSGRLKVAAPVAFARNQIAPIIADFLRRYPDIQLEMTLSPRAVNLIEEGTDVAIRIMPATQADGRSQVLAPNRRVFCAAPSYLAQAGTPQIPEDLMRHACLMGLGGVGADHWRFQRGGRVEQVRVSGPLICDNIELVHRAALDGLGVAFLGLSLTAPDIRGGRLVELLADYVINDSVIVATVPHSGFTPQRVAVFIAFLKERFGDPPIWECEATGSIGQSD